MPNPTDNLADRLFTDVLDRLRDLKLSPEDRNLIRQCCADAAELHLRAMATPPHDPEAQLALRRDKAHLDAQLHNLAAGGSARITDAFWDTVRSAIQTALSLALAIA